MNISNNLRQLKFMKIKPERTEKKESLSTWILEELKKSGRLADKQSAPSAHGRPKRERIG